MCRLCLALALGFLGSSLLCSRLTSGQVPHRQPPELGTTSQKTTTGSVRIDQVIERAEQYFNQGKLSLSEGRTELARSDFDKAVDAVLESGLDVRNEPRLHQFYLALVERIYNEENGRKRRNVEYAPGFKEQKFEASPLDELSSLGTSPDDVHTPSRNRCTPDIISKVELRGLKIGMPSTTVKAKVPGLKLGAPDRFGRIQGFVDAKQARLTAPFKDVMAILVEFVDGRLSYIGMVYDNSIEWKGADDFASRVSTALRLPHEWMPYRNRRDSNAYNLRELECEGSKFIAGFDTYRYQKYPSLHWLDTEAIRKYVSRKLDEEERQRRIQERRRDTFKP